MALGDSYTAGPLIPDLRLDPAACLRSTSNYPAYLAAYLNVRTYTDVSCSGAATRHVFGPQTTAFDSSDPIAPQLKAVRADTDLVTIGLGGNDFRIFSALTQRCTRLSRSDPTGSPCRQYYTRSGHDTMLDDARAVRARLARVISAVQQKAPEAKTVVIGYPEIVPAQGRCAGSLPFASGDYPWANTVERTLNDSLRAAAASADAMFVDTYAASRGHDACSGAKAWVNGAHGDSNRAAAYHPFASGMRGEARTAYRAITGRTAPDLPPFDSGAPTP